MNKIISKIALFILSFFLVWMMFGQIDWMALFGIDQDTDTTEEKLGELFWEWTKETEKEIKEHELYAPIDSILNKICESNRIDPKEIKLHLIEKDEMNAFALPGNHLIIYSGLITSAQNENEVAGVMAHEIAHLEKNHVMKKLIKEVGLSVLISIASGNGNAQVAVEAAKLLSSTAYDRSLESEADNKAVEYLINSNIDPEGLANFLYMVATEESSLQKNLTWISTHPDSRERAESIIYTMQNQVVYEEPVLSVGTWQALQLGIKNR